MCNYIKRHGTTYSQGEFVVLGRNDHTGELLLGEILLKFVSASNNPFLVVKVHQAVLLRTFGLYKVLQGVDDITRCLSVEDLFDHQPLYGYRCNGDIMIALKYSILDHL